MTRIKFGKLSISSAVLLYMVAFCHIGLAHAAVGCPDINQDRRIDTEDYFIARECYWQVFYDLDYGQSDLVCARVASMTSPYNEFQYADSVAVYDSLVESYNHLVETGSWLTTFCALFPNRITVDAQ